MTLGVVLLALPWLVLPVLTALRLRHSRSLDEWSATPPADPPLLSVIVPARDEARNIARCVRSVLASTWPRLELIVVDDHSSDGTAEVARGAAGGDPRLRVIANPALPAGWFGKQWACHNGSLVARGDVLLFTDADTMHGPELHVRSINAMRDRDADLFTVSARQEMHGFWERMVQPQPFQLIASRYGGTEHVNESPRTVDKIANGQCLFFRRDVYDAEQGHEAVRDAAAEDLALAQRSHARGRRVIIVLGDAHLSTRMYASLGEIVHGWGKNVFAAGRETVRGGRVARALVPVMLPLPMLIQLAPLVVLALSLGGLLPAEAGMWGALAAGFMLMYWAIAYGAQGMSPLNALGYPLGAAMFLYIVLRAIVRGRRVEWKGRGYRVR